MRALKPEYIPLTSKKHTNHIISYDNSGNVLSLFDCDIWDFSPYIHNLNAAKSRCVIKFNARLVNGTTLLDQQNEQLLRAAKEYLYVRFHKVSPKSGKYLSPQSLISNWHSLRSFINYLLLHSVKSFSQVTPKLALDYVKFKKESSNNSISASMMLKNFSLLEDLFAFKDELNDSLKMHPWPDSTAYYLAYQGNQSNVKPVKQTARIPDKLCVKLYKSAIELINTKSIPVFNVLKYSNDLIDLHFDEQIKRENQTSPLKVGHPHAHAEYLIFRKYQVRNDLSKVLTENGFKNRAEHKKMLTLVRTACYIVIALLTGMRNSEIASLKCGAFYRNLGWDNEEYCWLKGLTYKLETEPKPAQWMVPDVVEIAINHLTRISSQYSRFIERSLKYLEPNDAYKQQKMKDCLFLTKDYKTNTYGVLSNQHFNKSLSDYAATFDLNTYDSNNDLGLSGNSIWTLRSHQFRRTFACLAARSALGDLRYLREHFKHWSLDMTLHYANNSDFDDSLFDDVLTERNELQQVLVSDWISTDTPLLGGRGAAIAAFRQRGILKTAKDLPNLISQISDTVHIRGTGHSWCLASGDGCGGEGIYDAIHCVDCDNSIIDKAHLPMWKGLRKQHSELLRLDGLGVPVRQRAENYIKQADKIIKKLGEIEK
ncbi:hypothetical protein [Pseudoalteromonas phenolica]|uniref:hypothetical protein n=1 Tax=Pseudoalteromonas phenolica TaxID=161398 RepID=UPI00384CD007